jgi:hypothetical protein
VQTNGGAPESYTCVPLLAGCAPSPTCACLAGYWCAPTCTAGATGGLTVQCGTGG